MFDIVAGFYCDVSEREAAQMTKVILAIVAFGLVALTVHLATKPRRTAFKVMTLIGGLIGTFILWLVSSLALIPWGC